MTAVVEPEETDGLAAVLKALGHPIRLRLVSRISGHPRGEVCVCVVASGMDVTAPTVSHHLRLLREAGVLSCERRGNWVYYRVRPEVLARISDLIAAPHTVLGRDEPTEGAASCGC